MAGYAGQNGKWGDPHKAALLSLLADGLSYGSAVKALNAKFGTSFSRNAAIGIGKRMGLSKSNQTKSAPKPVRKRRGAPKPAPRPIAGPPLQPHQGALRCAEIVPKHLSLLETTNLTCKWPYGGFPGTDPITYCGHPTAAGFPYCLDHARLSIGPGTATERKAGHFRLQALK